MSKLKSDFHNDNHACWSSWSKRWLAGYCLSLSLIMQGCYGVGTEYAPGYSETAFDAIQIGDAEGKVLAELGEPLWIVGHRFYYFYHGRDLIFLVNKKTGSASLADFCEATDQEKDTYSDVTTLTEMQERLGVPERIIGVDLGQTDDPNVKSYIYSKGGESSRWNYRKLDIDKQSGKVVKKVARSMND